MRAYAVVRKAPLQSKEHVMKVTKNEPKIIIDSIQENKNASPHKLMGVNTFHQITGKGSSYQIKGEQFRRLQLHQQNKSSRNKDKVQRHQLQDSPKQPRTKKIFEDFHSGASKEIQNVQINEENIKENESFQTPVKILNDEMIIENEKSIDLQTKRRHHLFEKLGSNESFRQNENIIFQAQEKQIYCCGEAKSEIKSQNQHQNKLQKQQQIKSKQSSPQNNSFALRKRKIFEQFPEKKIIQNIVYDKDPIKIQQNNEVNEKQYKIKGKLSPIVESQNRKPPKIRIKVFQVSNIPIFDI